MAETPNTLMLLLRLGLSLGLVLGLVGAVTWALKRKGLLRPGAGSDATGRLEVVDRRSLGKRASIVVARIGDVAVLLGVTDHQVNVLAQAQGPDGTWSGPAARPGGDRGIVEAQDASPAIEVFAQSDGEELELPRPAALELADPATGRGATRPRHMIMGSRWTGNQVDAQGAATTPTGMSFVEALRELTVRKS